MYVYRIIAETVAYVEADSRSEAESRYLDGMAELEDTEIKEAIQFSEKEFNEILDIF